jgi:transcriptional regulator with XRE-family HTH domain
LTVTQDSSHVSATVRRWQLTETLRQLREQARLTHDQVVAEIRTGQGKWSRPKLSRIENREQGVKPREVEQLLDVYGVTDQALRDWLVELASTAHERGWMVDIRKNLPQDFHAFLNWEVALVASRQFETLLVPGLLQTAEYARALITGINPGLAEDDVERRVAARITRQQILTRATPPHLHVILDAGLFERPVGAPLVMRNQLRRLAEATDAPHITIQVLPKSVGASPALMGPFSILTLPDPIPDVGYAEGPGRAVYIEDHDDVRAFTLRFGILTEQALTRADSVALINDAAKGYE